MEINDDFKKQFSEFMSSKGFNNEQIGEFLAEKKEEQKPAETEKVEAKPETKPEENKGEMKTEEAPKEEMKDKEETKPEGEMKTEEPKVIPTEINPNSETEMLREQIRLMNEQNVLLKNQLEQTNKTLSDLGARVNSQDENLKKYISVKDEFGKTPTPQNNGDKNEMSFIEKFNKARGVQK